MQSPILIFDHINQVVTVAQPGPVYDKKVEEALAAQSTQVTTSSGTQSR